MAKTGLDPSASFAFLFHVTGIGIAAGVFALATRLGVEPVRAGAWAAVYAASPTAVLYENWLFYTHLVSALLLWGGLALYELIERRRLRDAVWLSLAVAAVACTRSLFHLAWAIALLGGALLVLQRARPSLPWLRFGLAMAPALLLVGAVYAKNAVVFDSPVSSTWLGMSLAKVSTQRLDPMAREVMIESGALSPAARVKPFSPLREYPRSLVAGPRYGHPALDQIAKPGNYTNFNHGAYVALSRLYLDDALVVIRTQPGLWFESFSLGLLSYAIAPSQYGFVAANARAYGPMVQLYEVLGGVPEAFTGARSKEAFGDPAYLLRRIRWLYWAAAAFAIGWALTSLFHPGAVAKRATLLYSLTNIAWVVVLANAVELGENQRFQVMLAPLQLVLIAAALDATWRRLRPAPVT